MTSQLDQASKNPTSQQIKEAEKELDQLESAYADIAADAALTAASMAPPPFGTAADVVSIGRSLWTGDWGGALLDTVGLIPVVGDGIKGAGKGTKIAAKMDEVADAIKAAKAALARRKAVAILSNRKAAAQKYWADIKAKGKAEYDEAIKGCSTVACKEAAALRKGPQYNQTPKTGKNGAWVGERGDGDWIPSPGSPLDEGLKEFNTKHGTNIDRIVYKDGFPDYGPFVYKTPDGVPARVEIPYKGGRKDAPVADEAMREKLGDPDWQAPENYTWHHMEDGVTMELVPSKVHGSNKSGHAGGTSLTKQPDF